MPDLAITNAVLQPDGRTVRLTTAPQTAVTYDLLAIHVTDIAGNVVDPTHDTAQFAGDVLPSLTSATATSSSNIRLLFDEAMANDAALVLHTNYDFSICPVGAVITVSEVTRVDATNVDITIAGEMLTGVANYTVAVINVSDLHGNVIDPAHAAAAFNGLGVAPQVASATSTAIDTIRVVFDEAMSVVGLDTNVNYSFSGQGQIDAPIAIDHIDIANPTTVDITTTGEMKTGVANYTVTVINVTDVIGNIIDAGHDDATFNGIGVAPQVTSATATAATTVRIVFNEDMSDTGLDTHGNYDFTICPPAAPITVSDVTKIDAKTVDITVAGSMAIGVDNYTVAVINVTDVAGNSIDLAHNSDAFNGVGIMPKVASASAINNTTIDVVFDLDMDEITVENTANYDLQY